MPEHPKESILAILRLYLNKDDRVLEIGSGTGEYAIHFAATLKDLHWVTSDKKENLPIITKSLRAAQLKNVHGPELLKVGVDNFPERPFTHVFSANTLHKMSWKECKSLFKLCGKRLREGCLVFFYGPFNYDLSLKDDNEKPAMRDFEAVQNAMIKSGFKLLKDNEMPANNRLLIYERLPFEKKL